MSKSLIAIDSAGQASFTDVVFDGKGGNQGNVPLTIGAGSLEINNCLAKDWQFAGFLRAESGTSLVVRDSEFFGMANNNGGGAIHAVGSTTIAVYGSRFESNRGDNGGAIGGETVNLTLEGCQFLGNRGTFTGGAVSVVTGAISVRDSLFSGNFVTNYFVMGDGGAIFGGIQGGVPATLVVSNSTFTGNSANNSGGAIRVSGPLTLDNSTVSGNTAKSFGGIDGREITLASSVVAANLRTGSVNNPDLGATTVTATNSLIGIADLSIQTLNATATLTGTFNAPLDPRLAPLRDAGGTSWTRAPYINSPLINSGANPLGLINDQRGNGFPRQLDAAVDIGAHEGASPLPAAQAEPIARVVTLAASTLITVTYQDAVGVDGSSIGTGDVRVIGPAGDLGPATLVNVDQPGNGPTLVATYSFTPPEGAWTSGRTGSYTVQLDANQVFDTDSNAVVGGPLTSFFVDVGNVIVVDNPVDENDGKVGPGQRSLREAIVAANANVNRIDTITFDPTVFGSATTIALTLGVLTISDRVVINGPAAGLTVDAQYKSRVLDINVTNAVIDTSVTINSLTLTRGSGSSVGGGIRALAGRIALNDVSITNSRAVTLGGGLYYGTSVVMTGGSLTGNTAAQGGGVASGTGAGGSLNAVAITHNTATTEGGGGYSSIGLTIRRSLIAHNTAPTGGGVAGLAGSIILSTVAHNTAATAGGVNGRQLTIDSSTVARNTATIWAGGVRSTGTPDIQIKSSIVADNVAPSAQDISGQLRIDQSLIRDPGVAAIIGTGNLWWTDPQLLPLGSYGGPTLSMPPAASSPVRDAAPVPNPAITTDQRGDGFARLAGGLMDMGAIEVGDPQPVARLDANVIHAAGGAEVVFTIAFADDVGIDPATIATGLVSVTRPDGLTVAATLQSITAKSGNLPRVATYSVAAPGGQADARAIGFYSVALAADTGFDLDPMPIALAGGTIGRFLVTSPTLIVDNTSDVVDGDYSLGQLSLREAIEHLNEARQTAATITLDPAVFGSATTVTLSQGPLLIRTAMTVAGPTTSRPTLTAAGAGRLFDVETDWITPELVILSGLVLTGGSTTGSGGAVIARGESLSIVGSLITGNTAGKGGGVAVEGTGTLTLTETSLEGNSATSDGGAVWSSALTLIERSLIADNRAAGSGGGVAQVTGQVTVIHGTIVGNTATSQGGGVWVNGVSSGKSLRVDNSTIVGNSAGTGGGAYWNLNGALGGSGFASSVIHGNLAPTHANLYASSFVEFSHGSLGSVTTASVTVTNSRPIGENPQLLPLAFNGGPTRTLQPAEISPLVDAGANPAGLATDARGPGFPRVVGAGADIGAVEAGFVRPAGVLDAIPDVQAATSDPMVVTVTWAHGVGVQVASLDDGDLVVVGPSGLKATAKLVGVDINTDGTPRTATYALAGPEGQWDVMDNGDYTVSVAANEVLGVNGVAAAPLWLGGFSVEITGQIVVVNTKDSGAGSLRDAVARANAYPGEDTIVFDPGVFAGASTIHLTSGQLMIVQSLTLAGPGADRVTLRGNLTDSILGAFAPSITVSGLRFFEGGRAITANNTHLVVRDARFHINRPSSGDGGAIESRGMGSLTVERSSFTGNFATTGGTISATGSVSLVLRSSEIVGATANSAAEVFFASTGSLEVIDCTFANNNLKTYAALTAFTTLPVVIRSSTFTGNASGTSASSVYIGTENNVTGIDHLIDHCTIVDGGTSVPGIRIAGDTGVVIRSSVVSGHSAGDIVGPNVVLINSAVGSAVGFTPGPGSGGNLPFGVDPRLGPLADNGGPTRTRPPRGDSPLIDAGTNPLDLATDQRGYPRLVGATVDIGAVENVRPAPQLVLAPIAVEPGTTETLLTITYFDDIALQASSIGTGDIRVKRTDGLTLTPTFVSLDSALDGTPRVAVFRLAAPGGVWDFGDNGVYTISAVANQVFDTTLLAAPAETIGGLSLSLPQSLVVTTDADSGPGSLRAAISLANSFVSTDVISFDPVFFATPRTITLKTGELLITDTLSLAGPGSGMVTLSGNSASRILKVDGPGGITVTVSGLTFTAGKAVGDGGAILNLGESLFVSDCVFTGNTASGVGGAIDSFRGPRTAIADSVFTLNTAAFGGALVTRDVGLVTVDRSSLTHNSANDGGGMGFGSNFPLYSVLRIDATLFAANQASSGGGLDLFGSADGTMPVISNSTFSGNTATNFGGGAINTEMNLRIVNSTIVDNHATGPASFSRGGGGIRRQPGTITLESSIVSGNTSTGKGHDIFSSVVAATNSAIGSPTDHALSAGSIDNLPYGTDLKLGPLNANGGPTLTHLPQLGSPLIDAGFNPLGLVTDQRGVGFPRVVGAAADIGAVEVPTTALAAPMTAIIVVQQGEVQRSQVKSLTVDFSQGATFAGGFAAAFELRRDGSPGVVGLAFEQVGTEVTLRFLPGPHVAANGSLIDGRYTLTLVAGAINGGQFDGNADGVAGDNQLFTFHRFLGDADGNAAIDAADFLAFRLAFLGGSPVLDFDGDGQVGASDFLQFRLRFLTTLP